jgi:hypothetical protein
MSGGDGPFGVELGTDPAWNLSSTTDLDVYQGSLAQGASVFVAAHRRYDGGLAVVTSVTAYVRMQMG